MSEEPLRSPDPRMIPVTRPRSWFEPTGGGGQARKPENDRADSADRTDRTDRVGQRPKHQADQEEDSFLRPFILTEGRTRPLHDGLRIETLVHARPDALYAPLHFEHRAIVQLCQTPIAVAEVASRIGVPLGVAKVLVADLYADNLVQLREPTELPVHVIERIRDLVRAL
ncbi:MAG TPA: DUF742 domain-containing protein [Pseudonocardiaceae bacterium]